MHFLQANQKALTHAHTNHYSNIFPPVTVNFKLDLDSVQINQHIKYLGQRAFSTTTTTILRPFFRDHPGELVPEENFWTLWCKGRLTEADTLTIWLGATPSGLTSAHLHRPIFYRPDALPAAQPTVSKH